MGNNFTLTPSSAPVGESTLSVTRDDLRRYIRRYLGISRTGSLDTDDESDVADVTRQGERMFYSPEILPGESSAHTWSFMKPMLTIPLTAPYSTGTVSITNGTVTLAGGTWPSWAADGTLVIDDGHFEVDTRTSNSVIVLEDTSVTGISGETYVLEHWRYSLTDGFGGAFNEPSLAYSEDGNVWRTLWLTGTGEILRERQRMGMITATEPSLAAVQTVTSDQTGGTRYELWVSPTPQSNLLVRGPYTVNPNAVSSGAPYPLGGMPFASCLVSACLSSAELLMNDTRGPHYDNFLSQLRAAIAMDRQRSAPKYLGSLNKTQRSMTPCHDSQRNVVTYESAEYLG